jgi:phospholipase/carboxylesterase
MNENPTALHYAVQQPSVKGVSKPPLLMLLHGYGSNEHDLMGLAPYLDPRLLIVSVRAPRALDFGGYGWFPIEITDKGIVLHFSEAFEACDQVSTLAAWVAREHSADPACTILLGFSQGASISVAVALREPRKFAAVAALSGRCVPEMIPEHPDDVEGLPVFMTHGEFDQVIPIAQGRASHEMMGQLPLDLTYTEYAMGHEINQASLQDVRSWLTDQIDRFQQSATEPSSPA